MQLLGSTELDPSSKPQKESYSYQLPEMKSKSALNEAVAGVELGFDLYFLEGPWALALALSFFNTYYGFPIGKGTLLGDRLAT